MVYGITNGVQGIVLLYVGYVSKLISMQRVGLNAVLDISRIELMWIGR